MALLDEWVAGETSDGRLLPLSMANQYRALQGLEPLPERPGTKTFKLPALMVHNGVSRGLGDSFAKLLIATRLKEAAVRFIKWWLQTTDCGCRARQRGWNLRYPWPAWWRSSVGTWCRHWI